jgi:tRNA (guanine-N7-)-methyltransferase
MLGDIERVPGGAHRRMTHRLIGGRQRDSEKSQFDSLGKRYLLPSSEIKNYFAGDTKNILEIGFGNGIHLSEVSKTESITARILGVEMYLEGVLSTMKLLKKQNSQNTKVSTQDARDVVKHISENTLDAVYVLFPDPWRKPRHNKRRILKSFFIKELIGKLKPGGRLVMATDWQEYADELYNLKKKMYIFVRIKFWCQSV